MPVAQFEAEGRAPVCTTNVTLSRTSRARERIRKRRCSKKFRLGADIVELSESPMPMRSGTTQRPKFHQMRSTLRQRYDEVGLPCSSTMGVA